MYYFYIKVIHFIRQKKKTLRGSVVVGELDVLHVLVVEGSGLVQVAAVDPEVEQGLHLFLELCLALELQVLGEGEDHVAGGAHGTRAHGLDQDAVFSAAHEFVDDLVGVGASVLGRVHQVAGLLGVPTEVGVVHLGGIHAVFGQDV